MAALFSSPEIPETPEKKYPNLIKGTKATPIQKDEEEVNNTPVKKQKTLLGE